VRWCRFGQEDGKIEYFVAENDIYTWAAFILNEVEKYTKCTIKYIVLYSLLEI